MDAQTGVTGRHRGHLLDGYCEVIVMVIAS